MSNGGFALMEDEGGGNLTPNQKSVLGRSGGGGGDWSGGGGGGSYLDGWKMPLGVVGVFTFIGFLLGCIATDMARNNADDIADLQNKKTTDPHMVCQYGDILFGEEFHETDGDKNGGYQIIGSTKASITWKQAYDDAASRCYNGHPGYLAIIGSEWENAFVQNLIQNFPDYQAGDDAWIGATDTSVEGTFQWIGPKKMAQGIVFYEDDTTLDGMYSNWGENEPNSGGQSNVEEDCVAMYGGGGKWYDSNCYLGQPYFVVEFGPPDVDDDVWSSQHNDELDDAAFKDDADDK
mmetsp:Transcript_13017/g.15545  ORF Transcript_13017/g.15545 Transcript_13017/m.15545 type:complete len:291 (-) Transcript_13017:155-1027(-)|eukprot:CAMPEP_0114359356 /NCGR_PEP_ID=MMETSP0101-20121206/22951_1 /TAXON_ID=38822 ORGANISM="Pteridomonas danica, Strain PT" /NCGR_SAMPLE_ID=MMETSP0101 /ASSEMBLY_ACC=CAM_ASM_000211 /LENGTH=290 /DNA_ID=CAMNT_0001502849 /DNA_START=45 /DNA_END=917 /DNA_ORIENTATION=-